MSEFNTAGYDDLRAYLTSASGWSHVALVDAGGTIETVIDIANDARASWGDPTSNPVTLTLDLAGGDADLSTPVELAQSALYTAGGEASAGDTFSNTSPAHDDSLTDSNGDPANAIVGGNDSLNVDHTVELPEVV